MERDITYCRALYYLGLKLGYARNLVTIFDLITRSAAETLKVKGCSLGLFDARTRELEIVAAYGLRSQYLREKVTLSGADLKHEILDGKPVAITDPREEATSGEKVGSVSMLCVPLEMRGHKTGVVCVYSAKRHRFSKLQIQFLRSLGNMGAVAIENARLKHDLERRLEEMSTIAQISNKLSSSLRPKEVFNSIVELTAKSMRMKGCILRLLDERGKKLEVVAAYGLSKEFVTKGPVYADEGLDDIRTGKAICVNDTLSYPGLQYPEESSKEGIRSILAVPLWSKEKIIGSMRVFGETPHQFQESEVKFLEGIASHAAISIQNAKVHDIALRNWQDLVSEIWEKTNVWGEASQPV